MHVVEQLAAAMSDTIRARVPSVGGQSFTNGAAGWDRKTYPMSIVAVGRTSVKTHKSGVGQRTGRLQTRLCEVIVEMAGQVTGDGAPAALAAQFAQIASEIEIALAGFSAVPVSDIELVHDSGLEDVETRAALGLMGTRALTFAVEFLTVEGDPNAFVATNA